MGNVMVGGVCGAAMAAFVAVLVLGGQPSTLGVAALAGGVFGGVAGGQGADVATFTGMRFMRYAFLIVILGIVAMAFGVFGPVHRLL
jgi:hypothetical protein